MLMFHCVRTASDFTCQAMPGLMALVDTLIACISPSANIIAMSTLFYLYAIVGMKLFGTQDMSVDSMDKTSLDARHICYFFHVAEVVVSTYQWPNNLCYN